MPRTHRNEGFAGLPYDAQNHTPGTGPTFSQGWLTPQLSQRQDSLDDQLRDVRRLAVKAGCYDAADWIERRS